MVRLSGQEQKAAKITAIDLQLDPTAPGLRFHKLDRAKDPKFWSVRVNDDIRLIVHRTDSSLMLCYVDHHDAAYAWAERRKIERHPTTGAAQIVELRERVETLRSYAIDYSESGPPAAAFEALPPPRAAVSLPIFFNLSRPELLSFGVPVEWIEEVREATEADILEVISHLPQEAQEALLMLAVGERPEPPKVTPPEADPFAHPDAQRRFRVLANAEELERALEFPWEKWTVFLHPAQRQLVERTFGGPVRVAGSAGTGKTIVALHRAVFLARRHLDARVLFTTFSKALANALKVKLGHLVGNEPAVADRIDVRPVTGIGYDLYTEAFGQPNIAPSSLLRALLAQAAGSVEGHRFAPQFLWGEWSDVVDAWQLATWEAYRDVARLGRRTRVGGKQRETLWSIFAAVRGELAKRKAVTWTELLGRVTDRLQQTGRSPFQFVVVDEAQDVGIAELRFLAALGGGRADGLFFTGDLGQRIFQQTFSWKALGVDVRGRSHTLHINYRTSHQIRARADRLLPKALADVDGNEESWRGAVSVFDGPPPRIATCRDAKTEAALVGSWIAERLAEGLRPGEVGVFVRAEPQLKRARAAVKAAGAEAAELSDKAEVPADQVAIGTMHLAKGLEFRAVAVMACDDEVIPLQERIESVADDAELEEVYDTERHLLYVACTRARDRLLVTGLEPASEFLEDIRASEDLS